MFFVADRSDKNRASIVPATPVLPEAGDDTLSLDIQNQKLRVNAQLQVEGRLVLAPSLLSDDTKPGTLVFDKDTSTLQFHNGSSFVPLTGTQEQQTSNISLISGRGIQINGTTITNSGLLGVNGVSGYVNVTIANGIASISLPQSIAASASPTFASLAIGGSITLTGGGKIYVNSISQTASGNDLTISAGNNNVIFIAGGRSFRLPASGSASQTVCTLDSGCGGGSGNGDILQGGNSFGAIMTLGTDDNFALTLKTNGTDRINISNAGDIGIGTASTGYRLDVSGTANATALYQDGNQVCDMSGNCGYENVLQGGNSFGAGMVLGTNDSNSLSFETSGNTQATISATGATTFRNSINSTAAFQVQNADAKSLFTIDTTNIQVSIGSSQGLDNFAPVAVSLGGTLGGQSDGAAFSPDSQYMSLAHLGSPYITIYKRSGDTFTKLANPATLPTGMGTGTAWSPDGQYMSVAHVNSPGITIYKRSGDTFTKLANPATLPLSSYGTAWSPDGQYIAAAGIFSGGGNSAFRLYSYRTFTSIYGSTWLSGSMSTTGGGIFGGDLQVQGQAKFARDVSAAGSLSVAGDIITGGALTIRPAEDSVAALLVQNSTGDNLLVVDTVNSMISTDAQLSVYTNKGDEYALYVRNDGGDENRHGIQVQAGADDASGTTYYLEALDGDGTQVGHIANTGGTFALTDVSDVRTKTNITDTSVSGLDIINGLRVVDFNRLQNPDGEKITGFIAQEVQGIYAKAVTTGSDGMLGVAKDAFIPVLVKAAQEQSAQTISLQQQQQSTNVAMSNIQTQLNLLQDQISGNVIGADLNLSTLNISGLTTLSGLEVTGNVTVANLTVAGTLTTANIKVDGKIISGGGRPSTGAVLGAVTHAGNDTAGSIAYTTHAAPVAGEQVRVIFSSPYSADPRVTLTPTNSHAGSIRYYAERTATELRLYFIDIPEANTVYSFDYQIIQ